MANTLFKNTPGVFKGIQGTIIVGGVAVAGFLWYQHWKKKQEEKEANKAADAAAQHLQQLAQQGVHPSYDASQFEIFSQQLVQAMTGCGTDENAIYRVFSQMHNDADVAALIVQFGLRFYQPCAWTSPISYQVWLINDLAFGGGLPTWFGYDLSDSEIKKINSILSSKGINYKF